MSGSGASKKKAGSSSRGAQGWEEAGLEFYQESYPSNPNDFEVLQQNPKHLTTLLPSKKNRVTTMRIRNNTDTRTFRRYATAARRGSTVRRNSNAGEVQVSMMPDLSQNLSNEETTWHEIMELKALPISMAQKRDIKYKKQQEPNLRLQGFEQFKWRRRKFFERLKIRAQETYKKLELWRGTLKIIEGSFGTGVVAFFLFIKWLMFLNLLLCAMIGTILIAPTIYYQLEIDSNDTNVMSCEPGHLFTEYERDTIFFYGGYKNASFPVYYNFNFDIPIAYITVIILCFAVSLIAIVRTAAKGFKDRLVEGEGMQYRYCNSIFASWDFCIDNEKSAAKKQEAIYREIVTSLRALRADEERKNRSRDERNKIVLVRIVVNLIVIAVLIAAALLIYYVFTFCSKTTLEPALVFEYMPSITIVGLNLIIPTIFEYLSRFENFTPMFQVRLTLIRIIFLRLSSLFTLAASLYYVATAPGTCCWETYVGQQMYKLALTDFLTQIFMTFFVNFIRSRIAKCRNKFAKLIGQQYFELTKHVLDVVYLQTVCWFGMFFAPLLPFIFVFVFFILFYVKKFACLINCKPSLQVYRASRSKSMFMVVLLVSYISALLPIVFSIAEIAPSANCGPFQTLTSTWDVIKVPDYLHNAVQYLFTPAFCIPAFSILALVLYYYIAVTAANRHMVIVLKHQLVLEGHDKQFLLEKLSSFIKQQQRRNLQIAKQQQQERNTTVSN